MREIAPSYLPILDELSALAESLAPSDSKEPMVSRRLSAASGFSARRLVYLNSFQVERPLIVVVLSGQKELTRDGVRHVAERGDVFVLPAHLPVEMRSTPAVTGGLFRSFILELDPEVSASLLARHPDLCVSPQLGGFDPKTPHVLKADATALQAMLHFARTLLVDAAPSSLVRHRMEDLLLSLSLQHRSRERRVAAPASDDLVLAVRQYVRKQPEAELSSDEVAKALAVSGATLRRRLAEAGVTLRELRAEERMDLARTLLSKPGAQVAEVALRCGYRSPSKFARQFRRYAGEAPKRRSATSSS